MPELPEVETLKNALLPLVRHQVLEDIHFHRSNLRYPIPIADLNERFKGRRIDNVLRKGKYILFQAETGAMILHLGMSGRVTQSHSAEAKEKHTHIVFKFQSNLYLHFVDPRRFGCVAWAPENKGHPLLDRLGVDPMTPELTAQAMKTLAKGCTASIKSFLMDSHRLAGVGNIYACESLFRSGIRPTSPAGRVSLKRWERLVAELRFVLQQSIDAGGSTLRDFFNADGEPGYYSTQFCVYGKEKQACPQCSFPITRITQTGRSTFYCKKCQK
ncbi:MAG: bifunctional DNA-formamidopyrimidine glycosylase/DNA-(apurinic or apyrimidinic site) lyase [Candidatus Nitrohelix vancouverensis]|uniref:Formamidopyrimidine-DNA glycosylase n=1 Tax=Candidatus Nitrohelix vancouverensis TaxID=2705534 RepID=A0A7T0G4A7_9BACT|nr:MAG: bifunctional DNA-formamidopyrimidine glycosylase/DNA-(apurinic or apyrimidinic site) lyase [Candidatus Nitrohelix vancouverensis]